MSLYRTILRLHTALPAEIRGVGDAYVREEFRRHKDADAKFVGQFLEQWEAYAADIARSISVPGAVSLESAGPGRDLSADDIAALSEEQLEQLDTLKQEAMAAASGKEGF